MPSNLFVVVFPRKVQAHTVVVTRKEKPKSKWSVGGLRSPPGGFLTSREGRNGKGDDKNQDTKSGIPSSRSTHTAGSGGDTNKDERRISPSNATRNELKNQKTVRVQLSRPTEELVPTHSHKSRTNKSGHQYRGSEGASSSSTGNWHPAQGKLSSGDSAGSTLSVESISNGLSGAVGGGSHSQRKRSSCVPPPSTDFSATNLEDIFSSSVRSSLSGVGVGGGRERSSSVSSSTTTTATRATAGAAGAAAGAGEGGQTVLPEGPLRGGTGNGESPSRRPSVTGAEGRGIGSCGCGAASAEVDARVRAVSRLAEEAEADKNGGQMQQIRPAAASGAGNSDGDTGTESMSPVDLTGGAKGGDAAGSSGPVVEKGDCSDCGGGGGGSGGEDRGIREDIRRAGEEEARAGLLAVGDAEGTTSPRLDINTPGASSTPGSKRRLVTEVIGDDYMDVSRPQDMDEGEKVNIEALVRGVLLEMRTDMLLIGEPTFHLSSAGKLMTCIFPCDVEDAHLVLTRLESIGVGSETGSVNVLPMEIGRSDVTRRRQREMNDGEDEDRARRQRHSRATGGRYGDGGAVASEAEKDEEAARRANERFRALASQIRVTQVTEEIREGTKCHFDYMALLVASSAISAMGLATDNVAVVVAAMLVSPIMGPVLAFTFGTNVRDWSLAKKGFLVESFSLLICVGVGFVVGMVGVFFLNDDTWPTHEMETRGNPWGLLTGIAIAIPSGMAVALSILSKNVNSLVGVAISASLLPPAVNTGLCLSVALIGPAVVNFHVNAMEYVMIGLISMCLTIVNILSIYVAGVWLFIFKEVAPIKSENSFWSRDMIHARKFQQKLGKAKNEGGEAAQNLRKTLMNEAKKNRADWSHLSNNDPNSWSLDQFDQDNYNDHNTERKGSFSSVTNTHHRYRTKDRRRRPTVFDLFPDVADAGGIPDAEGPAGPRESAKSESGMLISFVAKFLDRGDENNTTTAGITSTTHTE